MYQYQGEEEHILQILLSFVKGTRFWSVSPLTTAVHVNSKCIEILDIPWFAGMFAIL